ncbi:MAG: NERD domain-containing protein, partial [Thiomargarita sp.]|nr:NERD domain-containing protein [Thiomargarita sp.]
MDFTPIINQIWNMLWYLIPLVIFIIFIALLKYSLKSPWFKGMIGEFRVNLLAQSMLDKHQYHLIKNVTLPTEEGTTQIDHIIVSQYGIFVIETKNMKGWIFGSPKQKTWTQKIYHASYKFQNPLHQNYKHTKTLELLLEIKPEYIHSVIVFVGDSVFKTTMPENVTYRSGYIDFIKSKTEIVLSELELKNIRNQINTSRRARSFQTNHEHVTHVKKLVAKKHA